MQTSIENGNGEHLLAGCPACGYCLHAMPAVHVCPECGLEFDRRWEVFGGRPFRTSRASLVRLVIGYVLTAPAIALAAGPCVLSVLPLAVGPRGLHVLIIFSALTAPLILVFLRRRLGFVAVGPAGVLIYRRPGRIERYTWAEIGRVRLSSLSPSLVMAVAGGEVEIRFLKFFASVGGGIAEAERLLRYVNHYPRPTVADSQGPE